MTITFSSRWLVCINCSFHCCIAKRHYFDNSQLCFFAAYQGIGCNHF
ncbi:hypothetical protein [Symbiopectobacterium purcellii]